MKAFAKSAQPTGVQLGHGAYGSVVEVNIAGALYAAKKLKVEISMKPDEFYKKFEAQFRILFSVSDDNIVKYEGVCFLPDFDFPALVMERLQTNLHEYLLDPSYSNLSLSTKASILLGIAKGLAHLHTRKPFVIHRDLTARNILLGYDGVAKISDFGNCCIVDIDPACSSKFQSTINVRSSVYMPPEASSLSPKFNRKLDIFSFGNLALFTCTQVFPENILQPTFYDDDGNVFPRTEVRRRQEYIDLLKEPLDKAPDVIMLIKQCLDYRPEERPTAGEIVDELQGYEDDVGMKCVCLKCEIYGCQVCHVKCVVWSG